MIANDAVRPFIIWTLQRTGGTNLTQRLTERSGLPGTEHEPFNLARIFGHVTEQWLRDQDLDQLQRAVAEICQRGVIIKHCVETVPWEVTESLVRASVRMGYRHLFLYRKNALDRLLSLHFAQKTGVWGPKMQNFVDMTGARVANTNATPDALGKEAFTEAVPAEKLVNHERYCMQTLTRTWQLLQAQGAQPQAVAYEDIYRTSDPEQSVRVLLPVLEYLGLSENEAADCAWVTDVVGKGDQGTRDRYRDFPGTGELEKRIREVPPFSPDAKPAPIELRIVAEKHPWVERCFFDVLPGKVTLGQPFELGGVIVLKPDAPADLSLQLVGLGEFASIEWGIPSQTMAKEFPSARNADKARFLLRDAVFLKENSNLKIMLSDAAGLNSLIAELNLSVLSSRKEVDMDRDNWEEHTHEEVEFWENWLKTNGGKWPSDYQRRIDPKQPLPETIEQSLLARGIAKGTSLKILDLGSGPLTYVGSYSDNYGVEVVPIDPLADEYNALIDKYGIAAPNRSKKGEAEKLECLFAPNTFDVAWVCNSLDHSYDPVLGFFQAYKTLKLGGILFLVFHPNEADGGDYQGLHNWNFDIREDCFIIESRGRMVNMSRLLEKHAKVKLPVLKAAASPKSKLTVEVQKTNEIGLFDILSK